MRTIEGGAKVRRAMAIGAGFGGLVAAGRLQAAGFDTVVYESLDKLEVSMLLTAFAWLGLLLLVARMMPRGRAFMLPEGSARPPVSVIVPARNEEHNLPRLLASLAALDYPDVEVVVVDDCSEDRTAVVAESFGARVIRGRPLPEGWKGKQWACWQGAEAARGDLLLFTDADTEHAPKGLARAVDDLLGSGAGASTALPFHDAVTLWEKLLGSFHVMLIALTNPYGTPRCGRVFAIGQYLLFTRTAYEAVGGHAAVRAATVEDLPIANACLRAGIAWRVFPEDGVFAVRMYRTFAEFVAGWRRNFRAGLGESSVWAPVEVAAFAAALVTFWPMIGMIVFTAWRQRGLGRFSVWGAVFSLGGLAVFSVVTGLAVFDKVFRRDLRWKARAYAA